MRTHSTSVPAIQLFRYHQKVSRVGNMTGAPHYQQMGGFGSGRRKSIYRTPWKTAASWMPADGCARGFSAQDFTRSGTLQWIEADTGEVKSSIRYEAETCGLDTGRLIYTIAETGEQMNYAIRLQTTVPTMEAP
jgi:hypothetical protein